MGLILGNLRGQLSIFLEPTPSYVSDRPMLIDITIYGKFALSVRHVIGHLVRCTLSAACSVSFIIIPLRDRHSVCKCSSSGCDVSCVVPVLSSMRHRLVSNLLYFWFCA